MILRQFYPAEILSRVSVNETELWERYNVDEGDWVALAAIFLSEIFSPAFLVPLADDEARIPLEVMARQVVCTFRVSTSISNGLLVSSKKNFGKLDEGDRFEPPRCNVHANGLGGSLRVVAAVVSIAADRRPCQVSARFLLVQSVYARRRSHESAVEKEAHGPTTGARTVLSTRMVPLITCWTEIIFFFNFAFFVLFVTGHLRAGG